MLQTENSNFWLTYCNKRLTPLPYYSIVNLMNDYTDLIREILQGRIYGKSVDSIWIDEAKDMSYSYSRGYYKDTRGDEVATTVLEAYSKGVDFDVLLSKNKQVRTYWGQIQSEKIRAEQMREKERQRQAKLAEKRAIEQAQKEEVMAKLTPEELEAFGFAKKPRKVTKR
jgi:hypothetical protein